jgi:glycine/D-amino acid oxidase-like deaminating enzyme
MAPDVVVIGGGLIAQSAALALADRNASVTLVRTRVRGAASPAAAGLLAPSIERFAPSVSVFAYAARAVFPEYVRRIGERGGVAVRFARDGIIDFALDATEAAIIRARLPDTAVWLEDAELRRLEPSLAPTQGGVLWQEDGAVDNVALLAALESVLASHARVRAIEQPAVAIQPTADGAAVRLRDGSSVRGSHVVLAAGAWSGQIEGAPFARSVEPVRGQLVTLDRAVLRRPVHCNDSYLVPRPDCTVAGSTMEWVGYDSSTTSDAIDALCAAAARLCPALARARRSVAWAGLRPVTPDRLPLLGRDPDNPFLIYACGHSRNGVLMTPTTADAITGLVFEDRLTFDLTQFRPDRFGGTFTRK